VFRVNIIASEAVGPGVAMSVDLQKIAAPASGGLAMTMWAIETLHTYQHGC
jgi:phosphotransferase system IIA component